MYKDEIRKYEAKNEQEQRDKELFIQCIDNFDDILTRENVVAHLTSSAFVFNKDRTKTLMIYHNIYKSWAWTGGHMDSDSDMSYVAKKELMEETGVKKAKFISKSIVSLDSIPVKGHMKKGKFVSPHLHLSVAFAMECDEEEILKIKEDENSGVRWLDIDKLPKYIDKEPYMLYIYNKIINRVIEENI